MISKIKITIVGVFIIVMFGLCAAISALSHERDLLTLEIERMDTELALSSQSLLQSNEAIARQNTEIRALKSQSRELESTMTSRLKLINDRYSALKKKADELMSTAPSCEAQLGIILSQQQEFLGATWQQ